MPGIVEKLDRMEKENERQHMETRALISFPLPNWIGDLQIWNHK